MYTCICMYACMHAGLCMSMNVCMYVWMYAYVSVGIRAYVSVCVRVYESVCMRVDVFVCIRMYVYECTRVYTYVYEQVCRYLHACGGRVRRVVLRGVIACGARPVQMKTFCERQGTRPLNSTQRGHHAARLNAASETSFLLFLCSADASAPPHAYLVLIHGERRDIPEQTHTDTM